LRVKISTDKMNNGFLVGDKHYRPYDHIERVFEVVSVPDVISTDAKNMLWSCEMELSVGDTVIIDYLSSMSTDRYVDEEGYEYRFVSYSDVYAIIKEDGVLYPLNGYVIMEKIKREERIMYYSTSKVEERYGKVCYTGLPNKSYLVPGRVDDYNDLKSGDTVLIFPLKASSTQIDLEYKYHGILDKPYFLIQRWRIAAVITSL